MLWIPITAAGIINGIGHYWGYRNFEAPDAQHQHRRPGASSSAAKSCTTTTTPTPTSAKLSVEVVRVRHRLGVHPHAARRSAWPRSRRSRRSCKLGDVKPVADDEDARGGHRQPLRGDGQYARELRRACHAELARLKAEGEPTCQAGRDAPGQALAAPRRRQDPDAASRPQVARRAARRARCSTRWSTMREELRQLWTRTNVRRAARRRPAGLVPARPRRAASPRCRSSRCKLRAAHA